MHSLAAAPPTRTFPDLPAGAAVAAVDAKVGRGAGLGVAMVTEGRLLLDGLPGPAEVPDAWVGQVLSCEAALVLALGRDARHLRLLVENPELCRILSGRASERLRARAPGLVRALDEAGGEGLRVEARHVPGGTETCDLPGRLNDLAHILAGLGARGEAVAEALDLCPLWEKRLVRVRPDLGPTRLPERRGIVLTRKAAAAFLGVEPGVVDALLRAGHLDLAPDGSGLTRRSVARVHEAAQDMREDEFFGGWDPGPGLAGP